MKNTLQQDEEQKEDDNIELSIKKQKEKERIIKIRTSVRALSEKLFSTAVISVALEMARDARAPGKSPLSKEERDSVMAGLAESCIDHSVTFHRQWNRLRGKCNVLLPS